MFYPSQQGNHDNSFRVPAQHIHDSSNFMESWAQNFSQTDLDEGKVTGCSVICVRRALLTTNVIIAANIRLNNESMLAYSQASDDATLSAQAANHYEEARDANSGRRSSAPAAPHLTLQDTLATQHFRSPNHAGESQDPVSTDPRDQASLELHRSWVFSF
jgi:Ulp1 family protease